MLRLIRRSLRFKVLAVVMLTTLVALLVSAAALVTYEARNYREFLVNDATTQADILARTSTPALQFDDPVSAAETLALLASRRGIVAAALYTLDGTLFAHYARQGIPPPPPRLAAPLGSQFVDGSLELVHPVVASDQRIGTVYLRSKDDLALRLKDYSLIVGLVTLLSLTVAGLTSAYLQRGVTAPLLAVTDIARRVMSRRDFTQRAEKTTEDEIGVLVDSFNAMLAEVGRMTEALEATNRRLVEETEERRYAEAALRVADQRKDEFLATLAHELRNPLAPMVTALEIMESAGSTEEARHARDIIQRQLAHMVRLIDDLLDVSRITRGKLTVQMQTVDLAGVMQNAIDTVRPIIDQRGHRLEVVMPERPVYVRGDAVRLSQVFSNLLNNAAKYTQPGGRIGFSAQVVEGRVRVSVSDNGIGMTEQTLGTVFEMFIQGNDGTAAGGQAGLGVGLGLAKRLVALHGGSIEAFSDGPGRGSRFVVDIDAVPAAPDRPAQMDGAAAADGAGEAPRRGEGHRILLVDDNVDFATSLGMLLEALGHQVRVAHDGAGAVRAAEALQPEVAFLDIGLPDMSGYELASLLRELPAAADTVLVALSGWGQEQDRRRSRQHGFTAHLVKPVDLKKVQGVLEDLVSES